MLSCWLVPAVALDQDHLLLLCSPLEHGKQLLYVTELREGERERVRERERERERVRERETESKRDRERQRESKRDGE